MGARARHDVGPPSTLILTLIPHQVGRLGQLEVSHWELARGMAGAQAARGHLGALCHELQAGRASIALVLGQVRAEKGGRGPRQLAETWGLCAESCRPAGRPSLWCWDR